MDGRWDAIAIALIVMACGSGALAFLSFIIWVLGGCRKDSRTLHVLAVSGLVCSCAYLLCGDYAVAVITGNTMGLPRKKDKALYWTYWFFERLPILTF